MFGATFTLVTRRAFLEGVCGVTPPFDGKLHCRRQIKEEREGERERERERKERKEKKERKKDPGGFLENLYGDAQSRLQNVDHLYTCTEKRRRKKKTITIPHFYD